MQQQAGNAETQLALQRVAGAAGQHADAAASLASAPAVTVTPSAILIDVRDAIAVQQLHAGESRALRERSIELGAIDDDRFDRRRGVFDRFARWRMKADRSELVEDAVLGETELVEGVRGQHAGAMHRPADSWCSSNRATLKPARASVQTSVKAGWTAANDDGVVHGADYTGFLCATNQTCVARCGPSRGIGDATVSSMTKRRARRSRSAVQLKPL